MPIDLRIVEESPDCLDAYGEVPIAFTVTCRLRAGLVESGLGGITLSQEPVAAPYEKDYDAVEEERPSAWGRRWDLSSWGVLAAYLGPQRVGGAVVAWNTAGVTMLEDRDDLAVLWDLRVAPRARGSGIGRALFLQAQRWAARRGCRTLKAETQDINVPACRLYARCGSRLGAILLHAYPAFPEEVQLLWYRDLPSGPLPSGTPPTR